MSNYAKDIKPDEKLVKKGENIACKYHFLNKQLYGLWVLPITNVLVFYKSLEFLNVCCKKHFLPPTIGQDLFYA